MKRLGKGRCFIIAFIPVPCFRGRGVAWRRTPHGAPNREHPTRYPFKSAKSLRPMWRYMIFLPEWSEYDGYGMGDFHLVEMPSVRL